MSEAPNNERDLLFMAYLDGELEAEERKRVELLIEANSDYASMVEHWRENGDLIRSMPKFSLDEGFVDRVLAAVEIGDSDHLNAVGQIQGQNSKHTELESDSGSNWRVGAAAIATLAAMLLLTLFVFPTNVDQPSVAENANPEKAITKSDNAHPRSNTNSEKTEPTTGRSDKGVAGFAGGPSKPALNKSFSGENGGRTPAPRDLVQPFRAQKNHESLEQVLWVDMKSHSTALADIEAVLIKNSMTILRNDPGQQKNGVVNSMEASRNHLVQRSNSRFEALHVIAIRSQVKKAITELSNQHQAKFQAIALPTSPGFFQPELGPRTSEHSNDLVPNGKVPLNSRIAGRSKLANGITRPATVQQIHPQNLISENLNPSETNGDPVQVSDATELRQLDEWFGLAEKEDEMSIVRLLLLVDTSSHDSDQTENTPSSDER